MNKLKEKEWTKIYHVNVSQKKSWSDYINNQQSEFQNKNIARIIKHILIIIMNQEIVKRTSLRLNNPKCLCS